MSQHTPGPWRIDDAGPLSGNIVRFDVLAGPESDPFRVCQIDDSAADEEIGHQNRKQAAKRDLANAHLIAAAPELLEACKAILCQHEVYGQPMIARIEAKLRSAIDKAEGNKVPA